MSTNRIFARLLSTAALAGTVTLAACEGSTGPEDDLSAVSAADLATFLVNLDASGGTAYGMALDPRTGTHNFNRSAPCPAGGTHSMTGSSSSTFDATTRVLSTTWSHAQTHDDCAVIHKRRDGQEIRAVLDGSITVTGAASYQLPETAGQGRKILSFSSKRVGSTTTTIGEHTRTCQIDVTETYDPAAGTFTVKGVMCGREVNVTYTPGQSRR